MAEKIITFDRSSPSKFLAALIEARVLPATVTLDVPEGEDGKEEADAFFDQVEEDVEKAQEAAEAPPAPKPAPPEKAPAKA